MLFKLPTQELVKSRIHGRDLTSLEMTALRLYILERNTIVSCQIAPDSCLVLSSASHITIFTIRIVAVEKPHESMLLNYIWSYIQKPSYIYANIPEFVETVVYIQSAVSAPKEPKDKHQLFDTYIHSLVEAVAHDVYTHVSTSICMYMAASWNAHGILERVQTFE